MEKSGFLLQVCLALLPAGAATATPVYDTAVPLSDWSGPAAARYEATSAPGLVTRSLGAPPLNWSNDGKTQSIRWDITYNPASSVYHYRYIFTNLGGVAPPDISHFVLDLSDDCVASSNPAECVFNVTASNSAAMATSFSTFTGSSQGASNGGMPAGSGVTGVKFERVGCGSAEFPGTIEFDSYRAPVWGDLFIKGGRTWLYNSGINQHATSQDVLDYIARPDGTGTVPEPVPMALIGLGLLAVGVLRRRIC